MMTTQRTNEPTWQELLNVMPVGVALVDDSGSFRYLNKVLLNKSGYSMLDLAGLSVETLLPRTLRDVHIAHRADFTAHPTVREMGNGFNFSLVRKDGVEIPIDIALAPLMYHGRPWTVVVIRDDTLRRAQLETLAESEIKAVAARMAAAIALAESEQRFRLAFEGSVEPMVFSDVDGQAIAINDAFCDIIGYPREELLGRDLRNFITPDDIPIFDEYRHIVASRESESARFITHLIARSGRKVVCDVYLSAARSDDGMTLYLVTSLRDITEEQRLAAQLLLQALHDPLTGLANRGLFADRLLQACARVGRDGGQSAVLLLDLDDFKEVNDTYGHGVGDELLSALARRLERVTRVSDTLGRFGGDEFIYLAQGLSSEEHAVDISERLIATITEPVILHGTTFNLRASLGVVTWSDSDHDSESLIQAADLALYEAKRRAAGSFVVFDEALRSHAVSRFTMLRDLRSSVEADELTLRYQPIVELSDASVVGYEALMRWRQPEQGPISPSVFIPLAETSDLILKLGDFALREAIAVGASWNVPPATGHGYFVTVNLSARQFLDADLLNKVTQLLASSGLRAQQLILEITERTALAKVAETLVILEQMERIGVGLALDDFGTGFSSLSYLTQMHPRVIKVDRSFVSPDQPDARTETLLEAIVTLGHELKITVVAEGIETFEQLERLRGLACDLGQGFYFSDTVAGEETAAMLGHHFAV